MMKWGVVVVRSRYGICGTTPPWLSDGQKRQGGQGGGAEIPPGPNAASEFSFGVGADVGQEAAMGACLTKWEALYESTFPARSSSRCHAYPGSNTTNGTP